MQQIFNYLVRIWNIVTQILNIVQAVQSGMLALATKDELDLVSADTSATFAIVEDPTTGLVALGARLDAYYSALAATTDDIQTRVVAMQAILDGGLAALDPGNVYSMITAGQVWEYEDVVSTKTTLQMLENAGTASEQRGFVQVEEISPFAFAGWVLVGVWGEGGVGDPDPNTTFELPFDTILPTDATSADWLLRVAGDQPWLPPFQNGCLGLNDNDSDNWSWVVDFPQDKWIALKADLFGTSATTGLPVWPGLAGVTLGTSVALDTGLTVAGPLQGVLIALTSVPDSKSFFDFNGDLSYRNLGALTFQSDNGDDELPQSLGFTSALYLPKTMASADAVLIRTTGGVVGTVTPFTIP